MISFGAPGERKRVSERLSSGQKAKQKKKEREKRRQMSVCLKCGFVPDELQLGVDVINAVGFSPSCWAAVEAFSVDNTNPPAKT